jgi:hypothetical protein
VATIAVKITNDAVAKAPLTKVKNNKNNKKPLKFLVFVFLARVI